MPCIYPKLLVNTKLKVEHLALFTSSLLHLIPVLVLEVLAEMLRIQALDALLLLVTDSGSLNL